jgi:hypothetical protein
MINLIGFVVLLFMAYVVSSILFLRKELSDLDLLTQQRVRHLRKQVAELKLKNLKGSKLENDIEV